MIHTLAYLLVFSAAAMGQVAGTPAGPSDTEYRATVRVRCFAHPGLPRHRGELAAETTAGALEATGLLRAVRPTVKTRTEWRGRGTEIKIDDVTKDQAGRWTSDKVDVYGRPVKRKVKTVATMPDADYEVTGTVSRVGKVWWVKATLHDLAARKTLKTVTAKGEGDKGLFDASASTAEALAAVCARRVIAHRSMATLRMVRRQLTAPTVAAERLEAMAKAYPGALEPAAVRFLIAEKSKPRDREAVIDWSTKVIERLRRTDPDGLRFLAQLGVDPYAALARECVALDKPKDAAAVHREAVGIYPGPRLPHWLALARLEAQLGNTKQAAVAFEHYLDRKPLDADATLEYALFLEKTGDKKKAAPHFRTFLRLAPDSPKARDVKARLNALL